jgi:hypothetical protein
MGGAAVVQWITISVMAAKQPLQGVAILYASFCRTSHVTYNCGFYFCKMYDVHYPQPNKLPLADPSDRAV